MFRCIYEEKKPHNVDPLAQTGTIFGGAPHWISPPMISYRLLQSVYRARILNV